MSVNRYGMMTGMMDMAMMHMPTLLRALHLVI